MHAIEANNLTKIFGTLRAVSNLTFKVREGEIFGMLGPNGAGKTTTIRMLACLISPTDGTAYVGGHDIKTEPQKVRESIGILPENPSLYERLTAYENMEFFAEAYGVEDGKAQRIRELLDFFNLWERRNDKVGKFSKGMKQKLSIARALVHNPPILFLDEPTSGLDPESAKEIRELMARLSRREKHTILLSTHRLEDAERLCNTVLIINKGKKIALDSPDELRAKVVGETTLEIRLKNANSTILDALKGIEVIVEDSKLLIPLKDMDAEIPEIVRKIVYAGGEILYVNTKAPSLEEIYLKLIRGANK